MMRDDTGGPPLASWDIHDTLFRIASSIMSVHRGGVVLGDFHATSFASELPVEYRDRVRAMLCCGNVAVDLSCCRCLRYLHCSSTMAVYPPALTALSLFWNEDVADLFQKRERSVSLVSCNIWA